MVYCGSGILQFGTEIVASADGYLAALLGASPGASTAVATMLDVIERCFGDHMREWKPKLQELEPSYGQNLVGDAATFTRLHDRASRNLKLAD